MADGLWLIDLISHSNIYCIKKIGGVLVSHSGSTSQKINIIDKKQITGFNLFKKILIRTIILAVLKKI